MGMSISEQKRQTQQILHLSAACAKADKSYGLEYFCDSVGY